MTFLGYTITFFWLMMIVLLWLAIALIPANIARSKGHSFWGWFFVSIFFWWITLFVTLFMGDADAKEA